MPNYVTNIVTMTGSKEDIRDFFETVKNDERGIGTIDFDKIIPMPKELEIESGSRTTQGMRMVKDMISEKMLRTGNKNPSWSIIDSWQKQAVQQIPEEDVEAWNLGVQALHNVEQFGHPTWYEWCIENWGTKWGSCGYESGRLADNQFVFQTAWNAPHPIMSKLSEMFPNIEFSHDWADEDFGANCGNRVLKNGESKFNMPQSQKEAYEFAAKVFRTDLDEMGLRINAAGTNYVWCDFENYELVSIWNKPALFCEERITEDDIPEGFNLYHLRATYNDCYTIEPHVNEDFAGCIITNDTIEFYDHRFLILGQNDFVRLETPEEISFDDFVSERYDFDRFDFDEGMGGME